jgi:hypothetical protein
MNIVGRMPAHAVIAFATMSFASGCTEAALLTTPTLLHAPASARRDVVESEHFWSDSTGMYHWDGQPPPGDEFPASISSAKAGGYAPRPGTGGWVSGTMVFVGDQYKIDLDYTVRNNDTDALYQTGHPTSDWKFGNSMYSRQSYEERFEHSLHLDMCGYSVEASGTANARKALPFSIRPSLITIGPTGLGGPGFRIGLEPYTWGAIDRPLAAFSDAGIRCDEDLSHYSRNCDDASTPEVEYCPVEGDPARRPDGPIGGSDGSPTPRQDWGGEYTGFSSGSVCVGWIDWWSSFDGGRTWRYDYRECRDYQNVQ